MNIISENLLKVGTLKNLELDLSNTKLTEEEGIDSIIKNRQLLMDLDDISTKVLY